jgi:hypothetical protein
VRQIIRVALCGRIAKNSLRIAAVVGTILNVINQAIPFSNGMAVSWINVALNYLVPFCVASYSAAKNELAREAKSTEKSIG